MHTHVEWADQETPTRLEKSKDYGPSAYSSGV